MGRSKKPHELLIPKAAGKPFSGIDRSVAAMSRSVEGNRIQDTTGARTSAVRGGGAQDQGSRGSASVEDNQQARRVLENIESDGDGEEEGEGESSMSGDHWRRQLERRGKGSELPNAPFVRYQTRQALAVLILCWHWHAADASVGCGADA
eukprot:1130250-Rhodomonas_salina.1